ncbi:TetR/AcrR family transcriptional regulator [Nocardia gipuzkoensis]|uniref:TetR/AcrR family transcriptional regulator n=1 Tax=Nocardia gipuzkoensis TaxID=2749991 RepID=UPI0015EFAD87|nr:TetR/AcrR family transcriptional regulator [Nocardia gipuzkoensis]
MTTAQARKRRAYAARVPDAQRREQLLDAALHLVVTRGHSAVTMAAVAQQAEVTKPVVYGQFANRAELLAALLEREQQRALADLLEALPDRGEDVPVDEIDRWLVESLDHFLGVVRKAPERWQCVVLPMPDMPPEFHTARERARRFAADMARAGAEPLLARLDAPNELDAELVAHLGLGMLETAVRLVLTDHFTSERFVAALRAAITLTTIAGKR